MSGYFLPLARQRLVFVSFRLNTSWFLALQRNEVKKTMLRRKPQQSHETFSEWLTDAAHTRGIEHSKREMRGLYCLVLWIFFYTIWTGAGECQFQLPNRELFTLL